MSQNVTFTNDNTRESHESKKDLLRNSLLARRRSSLGKLFEHNSLKKFHKRNSLFKIKENKTPITRLDAFGTLINKNKKHKVTFIDVVSSKDLVEIIEIDSNNLCFYGKKNFSKKTKEKYLINDSEDFTCSCNVF